MSTETEMKVYEYVNLDYLNMMADGDDEMKKVMLAMLFEEMPLELVKMTELCAAGEWTELSAACHKMKSTLSFVGNKDMTEANSILEILSKTGEEPESYPGFLQVLHDVWPKVKGELQQEHDGI